MQGLLLIDKGKGITSFGAVAKIKKITGEKRVGHTGTLDPMATGVLPIFIGRATTLSSFLLEADKRYTATFRFGIETDTDDITGEVLSEKAVNITGEEISLALKHFTGEIKQLPPTYSALKKDGVPAYKLARSGQEVKREPRRVTINSIEVLKEFDGKEITVDVSCSKGTYIRALCRDIGEHLGCGATLSALRRTYTSGFSIDETVPLDKLNSENISSYIISEERAVENLRSVEVTLRQAVRFSNGGQLDFERLKDDFNTNGELVRVKYSDKLVGIGVVDTEKNHIAIKCLVNMIKEK